MTRRPRRGRIEWESLPMPTPEEIREAKEWLRARTGERAPQACYVDGYYDPDGRGHKVDTGEDYCRACAETEAARHNALGADHIGVGEVQESDAASLCNTCGCRLDVDLTRYGVDSELGITEEDPLGVALDVDGAEQCAAALMPDDPRWALWLWHVDVMRARARS